MTFLDEFQVTIDPIARHMILTPLTAISGETLHGGCPEVWWRRKFRYLRRQIEDVDAYLSKRQSAHMTLGISNPSQSKLAKTLRYYQAELATLEHKATLVSVPRSWRYE